MTAPKSTPATSTDPEPITRLRVVAYLRVSTDAQLDGNGLEIQAEAVRAWAEANGATVVATFADEGVSGTNGVENREALPDALAALERDEASGLVAYSLDRLARKLTVQEAVLAHAWDAGATVYTVTEFPQGVPQDDPDDPMRTAIRQMRAVFAQLDRAMIVKRLKEGRRHKRDRGGYIGGGVPYGWTLTRGELVPHPVEQRVIRKIVEAKERGMSNQAVADWLNAEEIPAARGRWSKASVLRAARRYEQRISS